MNSIGVIHAEKNGGEKGGVIGSPIPGRPHKGIDFADLFQTNDISNAHLLESGLAQNVQGVSCGENHGEVLPGPRAEPLRICGRILRLGEQEDRGGRREMLASERTDLPAIPLD